MRLNPLLPLSRSRTPCPPPQSFACSLSAPILFRPASPPNLFYVPYPLQYPSRSPGHSPAPSPPTRLFAPYLVTFSSPLSTPDCFSPLSRHPYTPRPHVSSFLSLSLSSPVSPVFPSPAPPVFVVERHHIASCFQVHPTLPPLFATAGRSALELSEKWCETHNMGPSQVPLVSSAYYSMSSTEKRPSMK